MNLWRAPRIWPDGECFILGGGLSLRDVDVDRLRGRRVIAVNNAYLLGDWIDVVFFGDLGYLDRPIDEEKGITHREALLRFAGLKVTKRREYLGEPGIHVMDCDVMTYGISTNPSRLMWNLSSGACAINLAVLFGVRRIVLLGFDMHKGPGGKRNWHRDHVVPDPAFNPYPSFLQPFPKMAEDLKRLKVEVVNATPGSALKVFPMVDPQELGIACERVGQEATC